MIIAVFPLCRIARRALPLQAQTGEANQSSPCCRFWLALMEWVAQFSGWVAGDRFLGHDWRGIRVGTGMR